jgi:hypothetical protein
MQLLKLSVHILHVRASVLLLYFCVEKLGGPGALGRPQGDKGREPVMRHGGTYTKQKLAPIKDTGIRRMARVLSIEVQFTLQSWHPRTCTALEYDRAYH